MRLDDLIDRNMDNDFAMRVFARLAMGILHEPNGLFDLEITQFALTPDKSHTATVTVHALWQGQDIRLHTPVRTAA